MLNIHPEQMTLKIAKESGFVDWYSHEFMAEHLPECHNAFAPETRHEMVKNGRKQALRHGFKDPVSQAHFVTLMWHIGPDFHHFPGFQDIARATRQPGPERINDFYHVSEAHWNHAVQHTDEHHWYSEAAP